MNVCHWLPHLYSIWAYLLFGYILLLCDLKSLTVKKTHKCSLFKAYFIKLLLRKYRSGTGIEFKVSVLVSYWTIPHSKHNANVLPSPLTEKMKVLLFFVKS